MSVIDLDALARTPLAQAIGWALLQFVWQGALIGVLTALTLAALRRSAADVRYVVSAIALTLMITTPVIGAIQSYKAHQPAPLAVRATTPERAAAAGRVEPSMPAPAPRVAPAVLEAPAEAPAAAVSFDRVAPWLLLGWTFGVLLLTLRLLSGWVWVQRLRTHGANPARASLRETVDRLVRRLHIGRTVTLLESSLVDVPTVVGWLRPVVLFPASALAGLSPIQLEAILAHELAHIRRHDYLVNLLQTLVETLLFYHPAVWWVSRQIRLERENCCDDLAVSLCGDPVVYAQALADLEDLRGSNGRLVLAASGGSLLHRVRRLLGAPSHEGRGPGWLAGLVAVMVIVAMAGIAAGTIDRDAEDGDQQVAPGAESDRPGRERPPAEADASEHLREGLRQIHEGARALHEALREIHRAAHSHFRQIPPPPPLPPLPAHAVMPPLPPEPADLPEPPQLPQAPGPPQAPEPPQPPYGADYAVPPPALPAPPAMPAPPALPAPPTVPMRWAYSYAVPPAMAAPPAVPAPAAWPAPPPLPQEPPAERGERSGNFRWEMNGERLEVRYRGDVEFTDDDRDVKSLSPGGYLWIREGGSRGDTVEFRADGSGDIERRFWSGGKERPFDPEGRQWLAKNLLRFIRRSGFGAPERVARIYKSKGAQGVLGEISLVEGSWAKRIYFVELLKAPGLGAAAVPQILTQAGRDIDSDFELASLLIQSDKLVTLDAQARKAYFDAARTIESDFEMRRVFSSALDRGPIPPALLAGVLETSTAIDSDFEQASLLIQVAKLHPLDDTTRAPFFKALDTVASAFERRRVLSAVMRRPDLPAPTVAAVLTSADLIKSDFETASLLVEVAKSRAIDGALRDPFFRAVDGIDSSFERARVLQTVAKQSDVSDQTRLEIIRSVKGISSGHELAQVLVAVAAGDPLTGTARDEYIAAAEKLGDFEQGRVLSALVRNERRR